MATPSASMPDAAPQDANTDTATSAVADDPCGTGYVTCRRWCASSAASTGWLFLIQDPTRGAYPARHVCGRRVRAT